HPGKGLLQIRLDPYLARAWERTGDDHQLLSPNQALDGIFEGGEPCCIDDRHLAEMQDQHLVRIAATGMQRLHCLLGGAKKKRSVDFVEPDALRQASMLALVLW